MFVQLSKSGNYAAQKIGYFLVNRRESSGMEGNWSSKAYFILLFALLPTSRGEWFGLSPPLKPSVTFIIHQSPRIDPLLSLLRIDPRMEAPDTDLVTRVMSDASLTVRNGNSLELSCGTIYPVSWWKKGENVRKVAVYFGFRFNRIIAIYFKFNSLSVKL